MRPALLAIRAAIRSRLRSWACALLLAVLGCAPAAAATCTWSGLGGDQLWSTPGNWQGGVAPVAGDAVVFPANVIGGKTAWNDRAHGTTFASVTIADNGYSVTGSPLSVSGTVTFAPMMPGSSTWLIPTTLANDLALDMRNGVLVMIEIETAGHRLTKTGPGDCAIHGLHGTGSLRAEEGVAFLTAAGTYSGGTTLAGGEVALYSSTSAGTGEIHLSAPSGAVRLVGNGLLVANAWRFDGGSATIRSESGTQALTGPMDIAASAPVVIDILAGAVSITGALSGTNGLRKTGAGDLRFAWPAGVPAATATYAGPLQVAGGRVVATPTGISPSSSVVVEAGGQLELMGAGTYPPVVTRLNGLGPAGAGALLVSADAVLPILQLDTAASIAVGVGATAQAAALSVVSGFLMKYGAGTLRCTGTADLRNAVVGLGTLEVATTAPAPLRDDLFIQQFGTVVLAAPGMCDPALDIVISTGLAGALEVTGAETVRSLNGDGIVRLRDGAVLTVGGGTFTGPLRSAPGGVGLPPLLRKEGPATLELLGFVDLGRGVELHQGLMVIQEFGWDTDLAVLGGTLRGRGSVRALTCQGAGILHPVGSIACQTLALSSGATLRCTALSSGGLVVRDSADLGGAFLDAALPAFGIEHELIRMEGWQAATGGFAFLEPIPLDWHGGDGNDLVLRDARVDQGQTQADPTSSGTIVFDAVFSQPANGFTPDDVVLSGTAQPTEVALTSLSAGRVWTITVGGMDRPGTATIAIPAGCVTDAGGNANAAAFSTDATVTFAPTQAGVTVAPAAGQGSPSNASTLAFTATFDAAVTGFTSADVVLGGNAGATTAVVTGSGTTYAIAVSGMTAEGTVTVSIPAAAATDAAGIITLAAPAAASVVSDVVAPTATLTASGAFVAGQAAVVDVVFSEAVTGLDAADIALSSGSVTGVTGSGTTWQVAVVAGVAGPLSVTVAAGAVSDAVGNPSALATGSATVLPDPGATAGGATAGGTAVDAGGGGCGLGGGIAALLGAAFLARRRRRG